MGRAAENWFEEREVGGKCYKHVSKFLRAEFAIAPGRVRAWWGLWSRKERGLFAAAFVAREKLSGDDLEVLEFLMENGDGEVWSIIALLVARGHPHRDRALKFLLSRVDEAESAVANYYQALGILGVQECVP